MRKFISNLGLLIGVLFLTGFLLTIVGMVSLFDRIDMSDGPLPKAGILYLSLEGVIADGEKFLDKLKRFREDDHIKGILVQINSPGGVVGPSQEIYMELKRTREEFHKPVVVHGLALVASGAYYAAVGADKFVVTPGCMVGSIGAIMQFANLEKLWQWAKVDRFVIKTGKFKDIGSDARPMTEDEKGLLQTMLDQVLVQFKSAIRDGRKLDAHIVDENADGRIFTGEQAVKLGFADKVGTFEDARALIGEMTGLGSKPELFKPHSRRGQEFFAQFFDEDKDSSRLRGVLNDVFHTQLRGQPLFLWPGFLGL